MKDSGLPIGKAAAIAKLATSEVATRVSHQVEQHKITHGRYLYFDGDMAIAKLATKVSHQVE